MIIPSGTTVAVADGTKLRLFRTEGEGAHALTALPEAHPSAENASSGHGHHDSAANPAHGQQDEDNFAAGVASMLNREVGDGSIKHLIVIAAPKTLGEMRKHYSKQVSAVLMSELAKDLTGQPANEIQKTLAAA